MLKVKSGKKKVIAMILAASAVLGVSTTAILQFTDVISVDAGNFKSGTVEVAIDGSVVDEDNPAFIPGDIRSTGFTVKNAGDAAVDVRSTVILKCENSLGGSDTTQSIFDIYAKEDVQGDDTIGYEPKSGALPIGTKQISDGGKTITYDLEYSLDGNHEIATGYEKITESNNLDTGAGSYVLLFDKSAGNEWQNTGVTLSVKAEAKQHRNTSGIDWTELQTSTVTFNGTTSAAVPDRTEESSVETDPEDENSGV